MDELEAVYGPAARYSEHELGVTLVYVQEGLFYSGTLLYIAVRRSSFCSGNVISSPQYVVLPSYHDQFPEIVFPSDIMIDAGVQQD